MATPIKKGLSSNYLEFSNVLRPKFKPKSIIVYVESEEDIAFWFNILHSYETPKIRFEIKLPSNTSLAKGKSKALARSNDIFNLVTGKVGKYLLICIDSDYDYLLCEHYETEAKRTIAKKIHENDYIFQTYTYSIENLKCYAENLHIVCVAATFNDAQKIDFVAFMKVYSTIIYELFLWNLLFYSKGQDDNFTLTSFCSVIKILEVPNIHEFGKTALKEVEKQVNKKITELETSFPTHKTEILALGNKLKSLDLKEENAYLFVQGHTIFDNVVLMLLKSVCKTLKDEWEEKIKYLAKTDSKLKADNLDVSEDDYQIKLQQLRKRETDIISNNIKHYKNLINKLDDKVENILATNSKFENCFLFSKIKQDIDLYMKQFS
jgi:hypothetical protein